MRPTILVSGGDWPAMVRTAETALINSNLYYQHDGKIVRVAEFHRPWNKTPASIEFVEVDKTELAMTLTGLIEFQKISGKSVARVDCPEKIATGLLALRGKWRLPITRSVITAPTLRADGTILDQPGYDPDTCLFYKPQGVEFPEVPDAPTKEDARTCLDDLILSMVSEVPFEVDDQHGQINRSVFLSGLISAAIRHLLPAVPLHGFNSPTPGTGKSILVDGIAAVMTGRPAASLSQADDIEMAKILSAALQAGIAIVNFDNCDMPVGGSLLCQALTCPTVALRILGKSELKTVSNTASYFCTGNNLTFTGDIVRRAMRCTIDAKCERPEQREFTTTRPDIAMMQNRAAIVFAVFTILRAFFVAGQPRQSKPVGSFEDWSMIVRDALIWLGEPDPWLTVEMIRAEDPSLANNIAALTAWYDVFEHNKMTTKEVIEQAQARTDGSMGNAPRIINSGLRDALMVVSDNELNSRTIGNWLRGIKDRPIGGFIVQQAGMIDGNRRWQVLRNTMPVN